MRSKKAKQKFLTQYLNPAIRGELRKNEKGLSKKGARFSGKLDADKFYTNADAVTVLARDLVKAVNSQRSKRTFLVTIGIHVRDGSGGFHWVETSQPINRADGQDINFREAKQYLGRVIYAFLARELSDRDLVLQGSARHIGSLKANKGKKRDKWEKDGFLWQGHDQKDVSVVGIEYRIDHQTLS